ncbi:MAG: dihydropyrimidinase [Caldilineaceae bacterium]|nr:dihydropyrimidinase [Caldilineaceae bacterium]
MYDLVIKHGLLITPQGTRRADLAVDGARIAAIGRDLAGRATVDAAGCYVLPGAVDEHVHLQMPLAGRVSTDTFATGTVAAAYGGTTTVIDFVTPAAGESMAAALAARRAEADPAVAVDYGLHMTIPTWHAADPARLAEVPAMVAAGCATFKAYQAYPGMMLDDVALLRAMQAVAAAGGSLVLHSETGPVLDVLRAQAVAAGETAAIWHERTRPPGLEASAITRAALLAEIAGCPLLIFHVGNAAAVAAIAAAQARGIDITGETCPQYLVLTAEEHLGGPDGKLFICAPPLRSQADQDATWRALADGVLDVVSTDHCPWTRAEKAQPSFADVPGGVPSMEARLALVHHFGVGRGLLSPARWVEVCCTNPAQRMGLTHKGVLAPGYDADIVIFDPATRRTLGTDTLHEAADWTPYAGVTVTGWPRTVLLRGDLVVDDHTFVGHAGAGRFVTRRHVRTGT